MTEEERIRRLTVYRGGKGAGGGPEDPMLETRVGRLEDEVREMRRDLAGVNETLARIDGRLSGLPTGFQFYLSILLTWGAGAGIAFALMRLAGQ